MPDNLEARINAAIKLGRTQVGDVFTQPWGSRERALVILPKSLTTHKTPFLRLHSGGRDSNYLFTFEDWERHGWVYQGRIPEKWFEELILNALGRENQ